VPKVHLWRAPEGDREAGGGITADRGSPGGRAVGSIDWIEETFGRRVQSSDADADDARVDVRVATFEGAGHSVHNTRLEAFAEALVEVAVRGVGVVGKVCRRRERARLISTPKLPHLTIMPDSSI
jgi:hypothetical protein